MHAISPIAASYPMREIQASSAKMYLPQLLDEVERGETIVITRHGKPIARIIPEEHLRQTEIDRAIRVILRWEIRPKHWRLQGNPWP